MLDAIERDLSSGAPPSAVRQHVEQRVTHWLQERSDAADPPVFLALLTEAELLERLGTIHRYRLLRPEQLQEMGIRVGRELVLELDPGWKDPHFPTIEHPAVQEMWEELINEAQATVQLKVHEEPPNTLQKTRRPGDKDPPFLRWIAVHDDQPLIFVEDPRAHIPKQGWLHPVLPGDDALLKRKRIFTTFAGNHPALDSHLERPAPRRPFQGNDVARDDLEEAILGSRGVFVVQGPPGTGKTHLATEVVIRYLAREPAGRVLVCSKEHFALGHIRKKITSGLERAEVPFRAYRSVSLARMSRRGVDLTDPWLGGNAARELGSRGWREDARGWLPWQAATADDHDGRLDSLARDSATVFFCTTMDASMVEFLGTESFDLVIVEEAGKCYPSEILHAICLGRTALLIGDHLQLPPYQERRTKEAVEAWTEVIRNTRDNRFYETAQRRFGRVLGDMLHLSRSRPPLEDDEVGWLRTFMFLWERAPDRFRLQEQFRMEEPLSDLVGSVFYGEPFVHRKGELVQQGLIPANPLGSLLPEALDLPLLWVDTPHTSEEPDAGEDQRKTGVRDNQFELDLIATYLRRLRPDGDSDFVILTPYRAQKKLLSESDAIQKACARLTKRPAQEIVRTTDEYQGREAELTILSLVRNNAQGARAWGFMTELERLNVMFSRARFRQVVVGCGAHIDRHAAEAPWLADVWLAYQRATDAGTARIITPRDLRRG
ncbi:MAG: hypothetical protein GY898_25080 [Proteobacteria bacterium]|nr:hypothetical protein [Pseudomonadota bacterium]